LRGNPRGPPFPVGVFFGLATAPWASPPPPPPPQGMDIQKMLAQMQAGGAGGMGGMGGMNFGGAGGDEGDEGADADGGDSDDDDLPDLEADADADKKETPA
jgi:hypothetical protein